jgi:hypothetical protein
MLNARLRAQMDGQPMETKRRSAKSVTLVALRVKIMERKETMQDAPRVQNLIQCGTHQNLDASWHVD